MPFVVVYCYLTNGDWITSECEDEESLRELFREDYEKYINLLEERDDERLETAKKVYDSMDDLSLDDVCKLMKKLGDELIHDYDEYGIRVVVRGDLICG